MFSVCRVWVLSSAAAVLAVVVFTKIRSVHVKVTRRITLLQLRHFCTRRKLSFIRIAATCISPAYRDRLASNFRSAAASYYLRSSWKNTCCRFSFSASVVPSIAGAVCWNYAASAKTTQQIIRSIFQRISRRWLRSVLQELIFIYLHFCAYVICVC